MFFFTLFSLAAAALASLPWGAAEEGPQQVFALYNKQEAAFAREELLAFE